MNLIFFKEIVKEPIIPGKFCEIEIHRGYEDIGICVVGGCDTPLVNFLKIFWLYNSMKFKKKFFFIQIIKIIYLIEIKIFVE